MIRNRRVAIIGSGPAGAIAAWACHLQGVQAHVYSNTRALSAAPGAQYLHSPFVLPGGVEIESIPIHYAKLGTREGYASKIYGPEFDADQTSWDLFPAGTHQGWPLHKIYEMLHRRLELFIMDVDRSDMLDLLARYDLVFNSAPAALFASRNGEPIEVNVERVWIKTKAGATSRPGPPSGLIVYEGSDSVPHYRYSYLENRESWEYPESYGDPGEGAVLVSKPLSISAPPMHERIVPIGRYGKWQKSVLVDSVFGEVSDVVRQHFGTDH